MIRAVQHDVGQYVFEGRCELVAGAVAVRNRLTQTLAARGPNDFPEPAHVFARYPLAFVESELRPHGELRLPSVDSREPDVFRPENVRVDLECFGRSLRR